MNRRVIALALACLLIGLAAGAAVGVLVLDDSSDDASEDSEQAAAVDPNEATLRVRLMAPDDGCWTRTIEDEVERGCGSLTFPLQVRAGVPVVFDREPRAAWTWCIVVEEEGKIIMTRGPDSSPDYSLDFSWQPPELSGNPPDLQIEPVTC
jgi:hypothetical protein